MTSFVPEKQIGVGDFVINSRARRYLDQVIDSGHLSYGPFTRRFEEQFSGLHSCRHAIFMASGTCALQAALAILKEKYGWQSGDEVIVPAMTFIATSNVVLHNNLSVRFAEVEPVSCNLDPSKLEEALTDRTRAIVPVHLFGRPAEMEPIMAFARRHQLKVLEDSCETMFARYNGQVVGSFGDASCFSTYVAHLLVTGVGGFVEAALGLAQLEEHEEIITARAANARFFLEHLRPLDEEGYVTLPIIPSHADHMFMMFPIIVHNDRKRALVNHLEEHSIETRDLMPLLSQPVYLKLFGDLRAKFPVATYNSTNGFYMGCHQYLSAEEREYMVEKILEFYERR
jgi:dTDP-4-amino-4,6-dideoxygalactose transaminase